MLWPLKPVTLLLSTLCSLSQLSPLLCCLDACSTSKRLRVMMLHSVCNVCQSCSPLMRQIALIAKQNRGLVSGTKYFPGPHRSHLWFVRTTLRRSHELKCVFLTCNFRSTTRSRGFTILSQPIANVISAYLCVHFRSFEDSILRWLGVYNFHR
jgi:hypothetical protein